MKKPYREYAIVKYLKFVIFIVGGLAIVSTMILVYLAECLFLWPKGNRKSKWGCEPYVGDSK